MEIWLDPNSETPTTIPIRNRLVSFFGCRDFHKNSDWEGERWSIIWFIYKSSLTRKWLATELQALQHLGFNMPQDPHMKHLNPVMLPLLLFFRCFFEHCRQRQDIIDKSADANLSTLD